ncbi:MAG: secretin and TonB N-terminal domain-containing protein, partial [Blastomonas fulva]
MALTGRQLLYPAAIVAGRASMAIKGTMDADQALRSLLSGQPITIRRRGRNVIVLASGPTFEARKPLVKERKPANRANPARRQPEQTRGPADAREELPIVVTGSNIRSSGIGVSPLIELTAEDIERSGTGTIAEALALLPQNFGGTGNEDTSLTGSDRTINNLGLGSSVNLRGLGS